VTKGTTQKLRALRKKQSMCSQFIYGIGSRAAALSSAMAGSAAFNNMWSPHNRPSEKNNIDDSQIFKLQRAERR